MGDTFQEIEDALSVAEQDLPVAIAALSTFMPKLKAIMPYLDLLPVAIQGVHAVKQATGASAAGAKAAVAATLTPGLPFAPALAPDAQPAQPAA